MRRTLAALVLGLFVAGVAWADVPPPKGFKRVTLDNKITTEKEFPDYRFYTVIGGAGKGGGFKENADAAANAKGVTEVKFDPKTPIEIKGAGRNPGIGRQGHLVAVPKDAEKNYPGEKEFLAAIRLGKVEGQLRAKANFDAITTVKDSDPRAAVVMEFKVEKVDAKDGIVGKFVREEKDPDKKDPAEESDEAGDAPAVTAYTPRAGVWVAGLAASLAVVLAGLWLARRSRHG